MLTEEKLTKIKELLKKYNMTNSSIIIDTPDGGWIGKADPTDTFVEINLFAYSYGRLTIMLTIWCNGEELYNGEI